MVSAEAQQLLPGQRRRWRATGIEFTIVFEAPGISDSQVVAYDDGYTTTFLSEVLLGWSEEAPPLEEYYYEISAALKSSRQLAPSDIEYLKLLFAGFIKSLGHLGVVDGDIEIVEFHQ